jgi:hypothetical protein
VARARGRSGLGRSPSQAASAIGSISVAAERHGAPDAGSGACDDLEFDLDELREFLAADRVEVPVDPLFKQRLRRKLWSMIRRGCGVEPPA